jgi:segregation and condensation protein A
MEITTIRLAQITHDYMIKISVLAQEQIEALGDFIDLGSRLIHIKSLALLPSSDSNDQAGELKRLNQELTDYRHTRSQADALKSLPEYVTRHRPIQPVDGATTYRTAQGDSKVLKPAYMTANSRMRPWLQVSVNPPAKLNQNHISSRIVQYLAKQPSLSTDLFQLCESQLECTVTFLAILDLIHLERIIAQQDAPFSPLKLEIAHA